MITLARLQLFLGLYVGVDANAFEHLSKARPLQLMQWCEVRPIIGLDDESATWRIAIR